MGSDRTEKMLGPRKHQIPVGKDVYPALRRGDYVYVDKTGFIPVWNLWPRPIWCCSARAVSANPFFMSTLKFYYDRAQTGISRRISEIPSSAVIAPNCRGFYVTIR